MVDGTLEAPEPPARRVPLGPVIGATLFVAASAAFAQAAAPLLDIIGIVLFSGMVAWLNAPLQARIARVVGRAGAIVVLVLGELAAVATVSALVLNDLDSLFASASRSVQQSLAVKGGHGLSARLERALRVGDGVQSWLSHLPQRIFFNSPAPPAAGQRIADLLVVAVLTAFFMASGASIVAAIVAIWRREDREGVWELVRDIDRRAGRFLRHAVLVGLGAGIVISLLGWASGLDHPVLLGAWAAFWVSVPRLGWWIATAPVIATALAHEPGVLAVALVGSALVVAVGVRISAHRTVLVRPGVGLTMTAAAVGVTSGGAGAAIFFVIVAVIFAAAWSSPHRGIQLPTPLVDDDDVYHVGPLQIPKGIHGVIWGAVTVAVVTLAWFTVARASAVIVWIALAVMVAIAVDRPIEIMTSRLRLPRSVSLGVVFALAIGLGSALIVSVIAQGPPAVGDAIERLPAVVREAQRLPVAGSWLGNGASRTVAAEVRRLPDRLTSTRGATGWFPALGNQLIDVTWVLFLIAAYLIDGRRIVAAIAGRVPARFRRQTDRVAGVSYRALAGYARGSLLVSLMNGTVVLVLGLSLGIKLVLVAALWAFLWDLVPQVGGLVGGIPLLLFAIAVSPTALLIGASVYLLYQLIESNLIFPAVVGDSVELPGWVALVTVLAGAAVAGVVGAIVLTPLVGAIRLIVREHSKADFPGRVAEN